ncbi:MAG: site-2 protease family protein [Candidatus Eremiobacteraeota bacterium]|nr:site-2 protease family protein [Candidatus Eremiobacteraeota bacterium]MBC5827885.1 site-2 protease family protein [Candidatus Eremiobacteraeota bacterium]
MRVATIFGIDIKIHFGWIFIFGLVAWSLSSDIGPLQHVRVSAGGRVALALVTALLFFASVVAHELSHSLVARSRGIPIKGITLFVFGGVSSLGGEPQTAAVEGWVALVGPLTSFALAAVFFAIGAALGLKTASGAASGYLALANGALGAFNLLPAYPLDGGRLFHALAWRRSGDILQATRSAVRVSRVVAIALMVYGALQTLVVGFGGGLWLIVIGWFLLEAGAAQGIQVQLASAIRGRTASHLMTPPPPPIPANATVAAAVDELIKRGARAAPVMLDSTLLGIVTFSDLAKLGAQSPGGAYVTSIMTRTQDLKAAAPGTGADELLKMLLEGSYHQIPVIDEVGNLVGFVTREGVLRRFAADVPSPQARSL